MALRLAAVCGLASAQELFVAPTMLADEVDSEDAARQAFEQFKEEYQRSYAQGSAEHEQRFEAFQKALAHAHALGSGSGSATFGVNNLADVTREEMQMRLGYRVSNTSSFHHSPEAAKLRGGFNTVFDWMSSVAAPGEFDWVSKGAVSKVKDQAACGGCWAFAATGALEGAAQIKSGILTELSEQQFVDCNSENDGCNGGSVELALDWAHKHSLCTEGANRYLGKEKGSCVVDLDSPAPGLAKGCIAGFTSLQGARPTTEQQEALLLQAVAKQPVAVGISGMELQYYLGGVVQSASSPNMINHGVLIVGYGTDPHHGDYWKVKNSWGKKWGEQGYFRLGRNQDSEVFPFGSLAVLYDPVYPKISDACVPGSDHVNFWAELWFQTRSVVTQPWFWVVIAFAAFVFASACGVCCCRRKHTAIAKMAQPLASGSPAGQQPRLV